MLLSLVTKRQVQTSMYSKFHIYSGETGDPNCKLEIRGEEFETVEKLSTVCMSEVERLATIGCSGRRTITVLIHGSTIQSVIQAVHFFKQNLTNVYPTDKE